MKSSHCVPQRTGTGVPSRSQPAFRAALSVSMSLEHGQPIATVRWAAVAATGGSNHFPLRQEGAAAEGAVATVDDVGASLIFMV